MIWLIEDRLREESGYFDLLRALETRNLEHTVVTFAPFSHELVSAKTKEPIVLPICKGAIGFGTTAIIKAAIDLKWVPGVFINPDFNQGVWSEMWTDFVANPNPHFSPLGKVETQLESFFIRPNSSINTFGGCVLSQEYFPEWRDAVYGFTNGLEVVGPDTMVTISPRLSISAEYRVYVVAGKPVTASLYRKDGMVKRKNADDNVDLFGFVRKVIDTWIPVEHLVLDVFETADGLKVGEPNCINCSGFYDCDMDKLVTALADEY